MASSASAGNFATLYNHWHASPIATRDIVVPDIADSANIRIELWVFSSSGVELWPRDEWSALD